MGREESRNGEKKQALRMSLLRKHLHNTKKSASFIFVAPLPNSASLGTARNLRVQTNINKAYISKQVSESASLQKMLVKVEGILENHHWAILVNGWRRCWVLRYSLITKWQIVTIQCGEDTTVTKWSKLASPGTGHVDIVCFLGRCNEHGMAFLS